jgi:NAD(P)H-dependent FMN reductase
MATKIAGIAGRLRRGSFNHMLPHAAAQVLPPDVELAIFDVHEAA